MKAIYSVLCFGLVILIESTNGQKADRLCTTSRFETECTQLQRGNSEVVCERVQDSIECAQKIRNGTADFGVFTAESSLQLASLGWSDLTVVKELRHMDRMGSVVDFEAVVIVRAGHEGGIQGLKGYSFCHPGYHYSKTERWSERILKHFERTVAAPNCEGNLKSPAEIEVAALASFFKSACRPGLWSNNPREDEELKKKYPELCSLCNTEENTNCSYGTPGNTHQQALHCLVHGGDVAYVSLEDAHNFFFNDFPDTASYYSFLCPNGTKESIVDNARPCTWLSQPWRLIISSNSRALQLNHRINYWMRSSAVGIWETAIKEIIQADNFFVNDATIQAPRDYFRPYRDVPVAISLCSTNSIWCTTSLEEREKCEVVRAGGITSGVYPIIECKEPSSNVVSCLAEVSAGKADLTGIDSNFGFLARHTYNLTAALYAETENAKYSSVVVVIKASSKYERFENLRHSKACFAEFGGIASMAFINTGKGRAFFSKNECNYGRLLSNFFGSSCAPGSTDYGHDPNVTNSESLCSLCKTLLLPIIPTITPPEAPTIGPPENPTIAPPDSITISPPEYPTISPPQPGPSPRFDEEGNLIVDDGATPQERAPEDETIDLNFKAAETYINCNADATNRFYGNRGALKCLSEDGDVAILELQYLREHATDLGLNEHDFRIMCRNGTLADRTGFDVDENCPLTTIIDNEIVVRPKSDKIPGIVNALISFDKYFAYSPDFKMYNVFNGYKHLLFKDSTLGLVPSDQENLGDSVQNYKTLFSNLEECVQGSSSTLALSTSLFATILIAVFTLQRMY
ncbi:Transferrin [Pseudolycoriella hygida]|uniref:Transferrin n=1 Tax=Pseudolycoriella hygida TaxID=35572 RepID=A0A9Q0NE40_9DIPT|nr:Transferrin [Pseudolycoriella hygida]